jgi:hypothetical protein
MVLTVGFVAYAFTETRGVGHFDQEVIVQVDRPVRRIAYSEVTLDVEARRQAEVTANPDLFDWTEAKLDPAGHFTAHLKFTDRVRPFRQRQIFHYRHLVVFVEFEDGSRACRVADLPAGVRGPPVVVQFP